MATELTNQIESLGLKDQVNSLEQEGRMVLPGVQALFGFQLIAIFSQNFKTDFSNLEQKYHFLALTFTALSTLFIMTPAAYHRQAHRDRISRAFVTLASKLILVGMVFLCAAIVLDFFLLSGVVGFSPILRFAFSSVLALSFIFAWFIFPNLRKQTN